VQIIVEVEVEAGTYASEQYQSRISAPSVCPNCGIAQSLEAHGYYWRWCSASRYSRRFSQIKNDGFLTLFTAESCEAGAWPASLCVWLPLRQRSDRLQGCSGCQAR
jgi:hypothetical protein